MRGQTNPILSSGLERLICSTPGVCADTQSRYINFKYLRIKSRAAPALNRRKRTREGKGENAIELEDRSYLLIEPFLLLRRRSFDPLHSVADLNATPGARGERCKIPRRKTLPIVFNRCPTVRTDRPSDVEVNKPDLTSAGDHPRRNLGATSTTNGYDRLPRTGRSIPFRPCAWLYIPRKRDPQSRNKTPSRYGERRDNSLTATPRLRRLCYGGNKVLAVLKGDAAAS